MKTFSVILLLFLIVTFTAAQQVNIDSLKRELTIAKEDTNKVELLHKLSVFYSWAYPDTGYLYAQQGLDLAEELNYEDGIMWSQQIMSRALINLGNYPLALDHTFKSLSLAEKNHDTLGIILAKASLVMTYRELGDYKSSLAYGQNILNLEEPLHRKDIIYTWADLASVYEKDNQLDSAIKYGKKAYEMDYNQSDLLVVLGNSYAKKGNYDSAMFYYRAGPPVAVLGHSEIDLIDIYSGIAAVYKAKGNIDSAVWYGKKALSEKSGKTYPIGLLRAATILADLYEAQHNADSSLKYLKTAISLKDSLFNREKTMAIQNLAFKEREKQKEVEASKLKYHNQLKMYSLLGGLAALLVIAGMLLRNNRNKQKANTLLEQQKEKVESTLSELRSTQAQLIQSEKMASLGELTAGIAHEIQNPLNFVNNFSDVNTELIDEADGEIDKGNVGEVKSLLHDIKENEQKINHHGKRADAIVKGMLQHSRTASGQKELTDINALADEYLRLAYHGLKAKNKSFNADIKTEFDNNVGKINVIPQDIGRVVLNLINNAFYAVGEKGKLQAESLPTGQAGYKPQVIIRTRKIGNNVEIKVEDNGNGIPKKIIDKIFQPFFTTKPTGQGTGLGLSLAYDIVKAQGGEIKVQTNEGRGSEFVVLLPTTSNMP